MSASKRYMQKVQIKKMSESSIENTPKFLYAVCKLKPINPSTILFSILPKKKTIKNRILSIGVSPTFPTKTTLRI
jgi:hypothetical protein